MSSHSWAGARNIEEAVERVREDTRGTEQDENVLLLVAFERASHVAAQLDSTISDVRLYGSLRHEVLKRMDGKQGS